MGPEHSRCPQVGVLTPQITDAGVAKLQKALPECEIFH